MAVASVHLVSESATGALHAQVRADLHDPASTVADARLDLAVLGESREGWVSFHLDAATIAGRTYFLVVQAVDAADDVAWSGIDADRPDLPPSWQHRDGWHPCEAGARLTFGMDPLGPSGLLTAGLLTNGTTSSTTTVAVSPAEADGTAYVPDSNVLRLPSGEWRYLPEHATEPVTVPAADLGAVRSVAASRAWLARGRVPGRTTEQRAAAARALLSIRALLQPSGAVAAAWVDAWKYSWPRDSSAVVTALAATGHTDEAYRILAYNARTQRSDGTWDARTELDGSGPPDDREWQLDANGWVSWSVWQWHQAAGDDRQLAALYPMVRKATRHAVNALDDEGLPPPGPDYWEMPSTATTIGTAAPLLAGLRASADLARRSGHTADSDAWQAAGDRLADGIRRHFAPLGYPRTADGRHGRDSAIAFLAPPFNQPPPDLAAALDSTHAALARPGGGISPGDDAAQHWPNAWTPSTATLALAFAGVGHTDTAGRLLAWILDHRTVLGELAEQVDPAGKPTSVAPLVWTDALVLLTLTQLDGPPLPTPPER
ncbi:hypothetical protein [Kutzneria sp. NPDC051319]|uniref:hypothetical protein n=1 Tax=Kutzneria sp. NPDC051319 TaxID=3155047 RepID=UPI00343B342A